MNKCIKRVFHIFLSVVMVISMLPATLASAASSTASSPTEKKLIVYFPNWGMYNSAHQSMSVGKIPWDKVSVINHSFFTVDSDFTLQSIDVYADYQATFAHSGGWGSGNIRGHFGEYKYYKGIYPNVKVLISVGGWTRGQNFHAMALTSATRATFINSVISFLKEFPFIDGIDIDWEYPGIDREKDPNDQYDRGCPGGPEDTVNFTLLLKEIREAYNANGLSDKLLTIAAPGGYDKTDRTQPDKYVQYLDFMNVMTYDFHGAWETMTNSHGALYANPDDPSPTSPVDIKNKYNTDYIMRYYRDTYKIPVEKLNVGAPFYSRGWKNVNAATGTNGLFAEAKGAPVGNLDNPNSPGGQVSYPKLKDLESTDGYVKYRDPYAKTPYLYNKSLGVMYTYEDLTSLNERCDYVLDNGYGGMIAWEISTDTSDFELTNTIATRLGINSNPSQQTAAPTFSVPAGTYSAPQTVALSCATAGASIYYTTNGTVPTANSTLYTAPITVSTTQTIKAIAVKSGLTNSNVASAAYTITPVSTKVAAPTFNPPAGTYSAPPAVTLSCATAGASIYYTVDGNTPTVNSTLYTAPITVANGQTIKAIAVKTGLTSSSVVSATFTITSSSQAWAPNVAYKAGDTVTYNGKAYKCIQPHTSLPGWEPSAVPSLWRQL
jgi:chitinase